MLVRDARTRLGDFFLRHWDFGLRRRPPSPSPTALLTPFILRRWSLLTVGRWAAALFQRSTPAACSAALFRAPPPVNPASLRS